MPTPPKDPHFLVLAIITVLLAVITFGAFLIYAFATR